MGAAASGADTYQNGENNWNCFLEKALPQVTRNSYDAESGRYAQIPKTFCPNTQADRRYDGAQLQGRPFRTALAVGMFRDYGVLPTAQPLHCFFRCAVRWARPFTSFPTRRSRAPGTPLSRCGETGRGETIP